MKYLYSPSSRGFYHPAIHLASQIPADATETSDETHAALLAAQSQGCIIIPDKGGKPVAVDPDQPSASDIIKSEIAALEAQITQRRMREALLNSDGGWLAGVDAQIAALRGQLTP